MGGKYVYQYPDDEGKICGEGSTRPEGCHIHWKRRQRHPCKQDGCVRQTASKYGFCSLHVNKSYSKEHYHQIKLDKMFQDRKTLEAMGEALDKIKMLDVTIWL
ncbi:hypothetical protein C1646_778283 [Rhizophagus diaphanus]|nr:hypothetical protein C1646_778283 [Rhizophagus diaphanus] [Rhizophagus sp. MUCL 43196]